MQHIKKGIKSLENKKQSCCHEQNNFRRCLVDFYISWYKNQLIVLACHIFNNTESLQWLQMADRQNFVFLSSPPHLHNSISSVLQTNLSSFNNTFLHIFMLSLVYLITFFLFNLLFLSYKRRTLSCPHWERRELHKWSLEWLICEMYLMGHSFSSEVVGVRGDRWDSVHFIHWK